MNISDKGLSLIKKYEGFRDVAYPDPATGNNPWTIGYGTTIYTNGMRVKSGDKHDEPFLSLCLEQDVNKFGREIEKLLRAPVSQHEFDAMVSLAYNIGMDNFENSTLLRRFNSGLKTAASLQFARWNKANGKVMNGLTARRAAEKELFLTA
jgi:lysozyme